MSLEKCKICKISSIPWEYIPEFNGHICQDCYVDSEILEKDFYKYIKEALKLNRELTSLKKMTILFINRWKK